MPDGFGPAQFVPLLLPLACIGTVVVAVAAALVFALRQARRRRR